MADTKRTTRHYWRITFITETQAKRHVWAYTNGPLSTQTGNIWRFYTVNKEGDAPEPSELLLLARRDVVSLKVAAFNNTYAQLETVTRTARASR